MLVPIRMGKVYYKTKNSLGPKNGMNISFPLLLYIMEVKYKEGQ